MTEPRLEIHIDPETLEIMIDNKSGQLDQATVAKLRDALGTFERDEVHCEKAAEAISTKQQIKTSI